MNVMQKIDETLQDKTIIILGVMVVIIIAYSTYFLFFTSASDSCQIMNPYRKYGLSYVDENTLAAEKQWLTTCITIEDAYRNSLKNL